MLVAWLRAGGVREVVEDSSGNAGASMAAYAARAGLRARVFVPETASPAKLGQIRAYGAEIVVVPGPRSAATDAAVAAVEASDAVYASHLWQPAFLAGTSTFAYELWEQRGGDVPDVVVLPLGGGTLLLGAHRGFARLRDAGLIDRVPRLVGVQAAACRPLAEAFDFGAPDAAPMEPGPSVAEGIRIARPPRSPEILAAVRETGGRIVAVSEEAIGAALRELLARGLYVEPTSAVALAGYRLLEADRWVAPDASVVIALTGHGLKTPGAIESSFEGLTCRPRRRPPSGAPASRDRAVGLRRAGAGRPAARPRPRHDRQGRGGCAAVEVTVRRASARERPTEA